MKKKKQTLEFQKDLLISETSYIKWTYEIIDNNNYRQIINNTDEFEVNKEIKSKIKILTKGKRKN